MGRGGRLAEVIRRSRAARGADAPGTGDAEAAVPPGPTTEERLEASPYFDVDWYNAVSGGSRSRAAASRHHVRRSADLTFGPHPLFDAAHVAGQLGGTVDGEPAEPVDRTSPTWPVDLFLALVGGRLPAGTSPHPLVDAESYLAAHPEAADHPLGVFGHYVEVGVGAGHRPNDWWPTEDAGDLVAWLRQRGEEWAARRALRPEPSRSPEVGVVTGSTDLPDTSGRPVSVVVVVDGVRDDHLVDTLTSVGQQTHPDVEVLLVHHGDLAPGLLDAAAEAVAPFPLKVLRSRRPGGARLRNLGLAVATAPHVAWLLGGDRWTPGHLARCLDTLARTAAPAVHDVAEVHRGPFPRDLATRPSLSTSYTTGRLCPAALREGATVPLSSVVARKAVVVAAEGFDEQLPAAHDEELLLRLGLRSGLERVDALGTHVWAPTTARGPFRGRARDASVRDLSTLSTWPDVVLNRHAVDWAGLASLERAPGSVSVLVPTHDDALMTSVAVRRVVETTRDGELDVEVVVVDNGTPLSVAAQLAALPLQHPGADVVVHHASTNLGFALGNNVGLGVARGAVVVLLNNDTEVADGWLEPLVDALEDPDVLGAQSLLVYPSGSVQSAGVAFPSCGGVPHAYLQGFPVEDAERALPGARLAALTAAAMALRAVDVVAVRGLDPLFRNGMEDVDLGLRLVRSRGGHFVVRPDSRVVHHESRATGRYTKSLQNRRAYLERWQATAPRDDEELWARAGLEVAGHVVEHRMVADPRTSVPAPRLHRPRTQVLESPPRLRWALKNPAPAGPSGDRWGDTYFVTALAAALGRAGQEVVVDRRQELNRPSGTHDDVALLLRGLASEYLPLPGQLSMLWVISHPEMLGRAEAEQYDVVAAASASWAAETSRRWGLDVVPLLQATDPSTFHPDVAVPDTGHPVLFVGGSRRTHRPVVTMAAAAGLPVSVYGSEWEELLPPALVKGEHLANAEVPAAYRSAGVVLNDHWEDMRMQGFVSNRLFDAVAAGARVVTDDVDGLPDDFGRSVRVVRDQDELVRLLRRRPDDVFGDDLERRRAAARVAERHSFDARAATLVDLAARRRRQDAAAGTRTVDDQLRRQTT